MGKKNMGQWAANDVISAGARRSYGCSKIERRAILFWWCHWRVQWPRLAAGYVHSAQCTQRLVDKNKMPPVLH